MVGRAVEAAAAGDARCRHARRVDVDLGIAEAIARPDVEVADAPRKGRPRINRIEVGGVRRVAKAVGAAAAIGARARRERTALQIQTPDHLDPAARHSAEHIRAAEYTRLADAMYEPNRRRDPSQAGHRT